MTMTNATPGKTFTVCVTRPSRGKLSGGGYTISSLSFNDEKKARDYYTDMLLRYPNFNVEFLKGELNDH